MFGKNPIRPATHTDGAMLEVKHIFRTLQGEGPNAGVPSVFIRLGGCNLACDFCDTEFEEYTELSLDAILNEVHALAGVHIKLIVITGGEPLRQNIVPLCERLIAAGFAVQLETNGTLWRPLPEAVQVVCSPKSTGQGYSPVRPDVLARATALKYIVSATHPLYRSVPDISHNVPIYIQPMDAHNAKESKENQTYGAELALQRGYRLSLQLHKVLGID